MTKKPKVVYSWITIKKSAKSARRDGTPQVRVECAWSLIGANGEHMCGSWPEGFRDKADARRSMYAVGLALTGFHPTKDYYSEVGPGPKPGALTVDDLAAHLEKNS